MLVTNNNIESKNNTDKNLKTYTLNSHVILREKNHLEIKDKLTKT